MIKNRFERTSDKLGVSRIGKTSFFKGNSNGYNFILDISNSQVYKFIFALKDSQGSALQDEDRDEFAIEDSKYFKSLKLRLEGYRVEADAVLFTRVKFEELKRNLDSLTELFRQRGLVNCCEKSGREDGVEAYLVQGIPRLLCVEEANEFMHVLQDEGKQIKINYPLGVLGAILGAIVGSVIVLLSLEVGIISLVGCYVLGSLSLFGFKKFGRDYSLIAIPLAAILTAAGTYIALLINFSHMIAKEVQAPLFKVLKSFGEIMRLNPQAEIIYKQSLGKVALFALVGFILATITYLRAMRNSKSGIVRS